jgi:hypothetical protein
VCGGGGGEGGWYGGGVCVCLCMWRANIFSSCFLFVYHFGKYSLLGDTFKTVLTDMEGEYGTSFMTERFRV